MARISDFSQMKKLDRLGINIRTLYLDGEGTAERNTDGSRNDNVASGIRLKKFYFLKGRLVHETDRFDSRIKYRYMVEGEDGEHFVCPNCAAPAEENSLEEGCPYCGTFFNIDYDDKLAGAKVHYDMLVSSLPYRLSVSLLALAGAGFLLWLYVRLTGRALDLFDRLKISAFGLIAWGLLYFLFYWLEAKILLPPLLAAKERKNWEEKRFLSRLEEQGISQKSFINALHFELSRLYYTPESPVIDFDIESFESFEDFMTEGPEEHLGVRLRLVLRLVFFEKGRIREKRMKKKFVLIHEARAELKLSGNVKVIRCKNCGGSVNAVTGRCENCKTLYPAFSSWHLDLNESDVPY